jgi:CheY-like chemotaxis protein
MPNGGTVTVETKCAECSPADAAAGRKPGSYAMLSVTDTGKGIDSAIRSLLFDPFFTTKEHRDGAGLGLSAVYGMVEQHGGFINVSSEPGHGARFEVYLPLSPDPGELATPDSLGMQGRETVLVVEDEPGVLRLIGETLRIHGYNVIESADSSEALRMATSDVQVDLLLTDIVMPKVNGRMLAETWKDQRPHLKVMYMSSYWEDPAVPTVAGSGYRLLQKPFSSYKLAKAVREILDGSPAN